MKIKEAAPEDWKLVWEIVERSVRGSYAECYGEEVIGMFLEHHSVYSIQEELMRHTVLLLYDGGVPVGTGCLQGEEIKQIYILPDRQGKGYGSLLLRALEEEAARQGLSKVVLDASIPGRPLYQRRGYREVSHEQIVGEKGSVLDYWRMEKELNPA
ncbi:GNAT family N-acetyltransferase [Zongyangia hominis]|uniref:GNAT family N-acetyltransferase n=1 Tax=Zongyangia hominis TaxID=2763677 RepID=A0A926EDH3_9FIRM|nr:GNAT family N-acetyltransferase [Zongyangia hominis]MBC8571075.1 GNAT family N-acetyltransferase [Zongyangia hominis]